MKFLYSFVILFIFIANTSHSQPGFDDMVESEMKAALPYFNDQNKSVSTEFTDDYDLKYHRFYWTIDPNENYIEGSVSSYFVALGDMDEIYFDLRNGFTIDSVIFHGNLQTNSLSDNLLHIILDNTVNAGSLDSITVYYQGTPIGGGFGSFVQDTHGNSNDPIIWTLSEPYGAMDWWPCKQDLVDKIDSIDVYVNTNSDFRAASNGILVSETIDGDNTLFHWKHRYPIPAYLIAIAV